MILLIVVPAGSPYIPTFADKTKFCTGYTQIHRNEPKPPSFEIVIQRVRYLFVLPFNFVVLNCHGLTHLKFLAGAYQQNDQDLVT